MSTTFDARPASGPDVTVPEVAGQATSAVRERAARTPFLGTGILLVALGALVYEVTLVRIFALTMWYHFSYLAVSLALAGVGAAGSLLEAWQGGGRRTVETRHLAALASAFGVSVVACVALAVRIRIDTLALWSGPANVAAFFGACALLSVPFLLSGLVIAAALSGQPAHAGRLYGADLVGSAAGAFAVVALLDRWAVGEAVVFTAATGFAASAVLGARGGAGRRGRRVLLPGFMAGLCGVVAASGASGTLGLRVPFAPRKVFAELFFRGGASEATLPSPTAQVDVSAPLRMPMFMAGDFGSGSGSEPVALRGVTQDGTAPTVLYANARDVARFPAFRGAQAGAAFVAGRALGRDADRVLVIGVGGGVDVMMALSYGAREVTAVEVNPAMVRMVERDYAEYLGHLFSDPRVALVQEDGRTFVRRAGGEYDVIQLSGVDTYTALATGAYTLSESYLYTKEAVADMYGRLAPGGYISYSRFIEPDDRAPRETLRLANLARTALEAMGVVEPSRHVLVFQGEVWASTLVRKGPFTRDEVEALDAFAAGEGFRGLVFDPVSSPGGPGRRAVRRAEEVLVRRAAASAVQDLPADRRDVAGELLTSALRAAVAGDGRGSDERIALAARLLDDPSARPVDWGGDLTRRREAALAGLRPAIAHRRAVVGFFEAVLRGTADERDAFVRAYALDLRPPSDDRPFFFDYYRIDRALATLASWRLGSEALPEFPVGHVVLATSFGAVALLGALLIALPLRRVPLAACATRRRTHVLLYFAALGCGFMLAEISLIQAFVLYLGHPAYSLSVVLASLLAFSGLGALASSRLHASPVLLARVLATVAVSIVAGRAAIPWMLGATIDLPLAGRVATAVATLALPALALGVPFPMAVTLLGREAPALVPWAWATNGLVSVMGSVLAIALAMALGFSAVLLIAAGAYALAAALVARGRAF